MTRYVKEYYNKYPALTIIGGLVVVDGIIYLITKIFGKSTPATSAGGRTIYTGGTTGTSGTGGIPLTDRNLSQSEANAECDRRKPGSVALSNNKGGWTCWDQVEIQLMKGGGFRQSDAPAETTISNTVLGY